MMGFGNICLFDRVASAPSLRFLTLPRGSSANNRHLTLGLNPTIGASHIKTVVVIQFDTAFLCRISPHFEILFAQLLSSMLYILLCCVFQYVVHITYTKQHHSLNCFLNTIHYNLTKSFQVLLLQTFVLDWTTVFEPFYSSPGSEKYILSPQITAHQLPQVSITQLKCPSFILASKAWKSKQL